MRGVFERPPGSGVWWISYFDGGAHHREKVGAKTDAEAAYRLRKTQIRLGKFFPEMVPARVATFAALARDALAYSAAHKRPRSAADDASKMPALLAWFGSRPSSSIRAQEIDARLTELGANHAPGTVNRYRALLSLVFSLAARNGLVACNPVARAPGSSKAQVPLRRENNMRVRFLSSDEERRLRGAIRRLYPLRLPELDLALHTGLRRGEQYADRNYPGLCWEQVDIARSVLTVPRSKHGQMRHVPINSVARAALLRLRRLRGTGGPVCYPRHERWFRKAIQAAKIADFHYHDLRHTFASRLVMAGVDLRTVQELMGHKALAMTLRYAHLSAGHEAAAVEKLVPACAGRPKTAHRTKSSIRQFPMFRSSG